MRENQSYFVATPSPASPVLGSRHHKNSQTNHEANFWIVGSFNCAELCLMGLRWNYIRD